MEEVNFGRSRAEIHDFRLQCLLLIEQRDGENEKADTQVSSSLNFSRTPAYQMETIKPLMNSVYPGVYTPGCVGMVWWIKGKY